MIAITAGNANRLHFSIVSASPNFMIILCQFTRLVEAIKKTHRIGGNPELSRESTNADR